MKTITILLLITLPSILYGMNPPQSSAAAAAAAVASPVSPRLESVVSARLESGMKLLHMITKPEDAPLILEVGCGHGKLAAHIARTAPNSTVTGIDSNERKIKAAKENYYRDLYNISFATIDPTKMPYENLFNLAISCDEIHWMEKKEELFRAITRSLKPKGKLLLSLMSAPTTSEKPLLMVAIGKLATKPQWQQHIASAKGVSQYYPLNENSVEELFKAVGLKKDFIKTLDNERTFDDYNKLIDWTKDFVSRLHIVTTLSPNLRESFMNDIFEEYKKLVTQNDGKFVCSMPTIQACAEKP